MKIPKTSSHNTMSYQYDNDNNNRKPCLNYTTSKACKNLTEIDLLKTKWPLQKRVTSKNKMAARQVCERKRKPSEMKSDPSFIFILTVR